MVGVAICQTLPPSIARKLTHWLILKGKKKEVGEPVCLSVKSSDSPGSQGLHLHVGAASFLRAEPTCVLKEHLSIIALTADCSDGLNADGSRGRGMDEMTSDRLITTSSFYKSNFIYLCNLWLH